MIDQQPQTWSVNGVAFSSAVHLHSALATTTAPPAFCFRCSAALPWTRDAWHQAERMFALDGGARAGGAELRRSGAELWYWAASGALVISRAGIAGAARDPANLLSLELEFLECGLALYLGLHGVPTYHAAAVEIDGVAVALIAASGSGKSSLTAALVQRGCGFLSDDMIALHGGSNLIWPGHHHLRLHPNSAAALLKPDQHQPLFPGFANSKRITNVAQWGRVRTTPYPLKAIYQLDPVSSHAATHICAVRGFSAARSLAENQSGLDSRAAQVRLTALGALTSAIPVRQISYPRDYALIDRVAGTLISDALAARMV